MDNFQEKIIFPKTNNFVAPLKNGKYAIYSVKEGKYITDFIFDKISYIPHRNYFVVRKNNQNMIIDILGNKIDFPSFFADSFTKEALMLHRFKEDVYPILQKGKITLIDTLGQIVNTIYFDKEDTGLAMNVIIISPNLGKNESQIPYVFIQNNYEEKHLLNWIKVRLDGTVLGNTKPVFDNEVEMPELRNWLEINKLLILMYWTHVETNSYQLSKLMKTLKIIKPLFSKNFNNEWVSTQIIHAKELEEYFDKLRDEIIGKPLDKIFYTGILYNWCWDEYCEYKNGEWYAPNSNKRINEPAYYQWKESGTQLILDSPVILEFAGFKLEIMYWSGSLVNINTNSIDTDRYGADVSKNFARNIIGQKLVDIQIHKRQDIYFMNFDNLNVKRQDGDDMFEEIWFVFENGYKLELTTDHCDYSILSEVAVN